MESTQAALQLSEPQGIQVLSSEGEALEVYWQVALNKDKLFAKNGDCHNIDWCQISGSWAVQVLSLWVLPDTRGA